MSELLAGALDALATRASWLEYVDVHVAFTSTNTRMTVSRTRFMVAGAIAGMAAAPLAAQTIALTGTPSESTVEQIRTMVSRLNLEQYKATVKGLTQFGDRRQGTDRNRHAVDWIEAELKSYGCTPTGRITYDFQPPPPRPPLTPEQIARFRAMRTGTNRPGPGGSLMRGTIGRTGVNTDSLRQTDPALRALDTPQSVAGERQEVYCTKVGTVHPDEMYIVSGHMDGIGWGEAANDDGSGTALVMQLARVFSSPDIKTDRSIRFILWNNEETGLNGSKAYVEQRAALQGKEDPVGSGKYPEPKWLGVIQHDMEMFDHGMPHADGTMSPVQRPEANVNIEFQSKSKMAAESEKLAWELQNSNEKYASKYPAQVGQHMTNTDSQPFQDLVPSISVRENERGAQIGAGWDPQWHQPTDLFKTYSDDDFRLGLNAAETTFGAVATLVGAKLVK